MDKKRSVLNVGVSVFSKILLLVAALYVRRLLIQQIGNDVNGLNSLYASILGMLAVAELGIGGAIAFSMYKPIVDGDRRTVAALFGLFRKVYRVIGAIIFVGGLVVMPFLPLLISDYGTIHDNVYLTFFLTLVSVCISYLYSAKTSLIEAHKDNYITTGILTIGQLLRYALQIPAILVFHSYTVFLICQILETLVIWALTEYVVRKRFGDILQMRETLAPRILGEIKKNIRAMCMHKIGTILVSTIDSLIISGFIGVVVLGLYSNYSLLAGIVASIIALFFSPLTSIMGHLCAEGNPERTEHYFDRFYTLNFILGLVFFLGYCAVADSVISLCFGGGQQISRTIVFVITLNQFTMYMRKTALLFRDASGTFYHDRWKPVAEGIANLVLSLLFVQIFPEDLRVVGVIAATILTTLFICDIVEPFVVFRHVFQKSPRGYYVRNYGYTLLFGLCLCLMTFLGHSFDNDLLGILANGLLSVGISVAAMALLAVLDRKFRAGLKTWLGQGVTWVRKRRKG